MSWSTSHENLRGPLPIPPKKALFPCRNVVLGGGPLGYCHEHPTHPFPGSASMPRVRRFCVCRLPLVTSQSGNLFLFLGWENVRNEKQGGALADMRYSPSYKGILIGHCNDPKFKTHQYLEVCGRVFFRCSSEPLKYAVVSLDFGILHAVICDPKNPDPSCGNTRPSQRPEEKIGQIS